MDGGTATNSFVIENTGGLPLNVSSITCSNILDYAVSFTPTVIPAEVIRATEEEKQYQITMLNNLHLSNQDKVNEQLKAIQDAAIKNENLFAHLMEATKVCSLGQITAALFEVGGQYRRNM